MVILGIETSCDETAAALVAETGDPDRPWRVLSSVIASQVDLHRAWGGVVPELSARQQRDGLGDAPWPPHYRKQAGEPPRVQPSRRRTPKHPLIEIGRAWKEDDVLAGLERWKQRHAAAAVYLRPEDILVDAMRGRHNTWTRIRVNLQHVPEALRPVQEVLDPDAVDLAAAWTPPARTRAKDRSES